jgi:hypothetical protein
MLGFARSLPSNRRNFLMQLLSSPIRTRRPGEWSAGSAILFIVTLAAKGHVTLAARAAGMSRKSAYALRKRDPLFARAWNAAIAAAAAAMSSEPAKGDNTHLAATSVSSSADRSPKGPPRPLPHRRVWHDRLLAELSSTRCDSPFGGSIPRLVPRPPCR